MTPYIIQLIFCIFWLMCESYFTKPNDKLDRTFKVCWSMAVVYNIVRIILIAI